MKRKARAKKQKASSFDPVTGIADVAEHFVEETTAEAERMITPVSRRYPTLFMLLVTFGVIMTFYGFERVIQEVPYIGDSPLIIFGSGILILILTGTLYKKLK